MFDDNDVKDANRAMQHLGTLLRSTKKTMYNGAELAGGINATVHGYPTATEFQKQRAQAGRAQERADRYSYDQSYGSNGRNDPIVGISETSGPIRQSDLDRGYPYRQPSYDAGSLGYQPISNRSDRLQQQQRGRGAENGVLEGGDYLAFHQEIANLLNARTPEEKARATAAFLDQAEATTGVDTPLRIRANNYTFPEADVTIRLQNNLSAFEIAEAALLKKGDTAGAALLQQEHDRMNGTAPVPPRAAPAPGAAPATTTSAPATGDTDKPETPAPATKPAPATAAGDEGFPKATGGQAHNYNVKSETMPPIAQNQVEWLQAHAGPGFQEMLNNPPTRAGKGQDGMYGYRTNEVFELACKQAGVEVKDVDLINHPDSEAAKKFTAALKTGDTSRQQTTALAQPAPQPEPAPVLAGGLPPQPVDDGLGKYSPTNTADLPQYGQGSRHQLAEQGLKDIKAFGFDSIAQNTDGQPGKRSNGAIRQFEENNGLPVDGIADPEMLATLGQKVKEKHGLASPNPQTLADVAQVQQTAARDTAPSGQSFAAQYAAGMSFGTDTTTPAAPVLKTQTVSVADSQVVADPSMKAALVAAQQADLATVTHSTPKDTQLADAPAAPTVRTPVDKSLPSQGLA